jgi:hypothetical protein
LAGAAGLEPATTGFGDRDIRFHLVSRSVVKSYFVGVIVIRRCIS